MKDNQVYKLDDMHDNTLGSYVFPVLPQNWRKDIDIRPEYIPQFYEFIVYE